MRFPDALSLPNLLSLIRILTVPLILALLYLNHPIWAAVLFTLVALSDAVDGMLARKLNQVTELGKLLDPLADKVLVVSTLIVLVELKNAPALAVALIAVRELLITAVRTTGAKWWGKLKTVSQIIAVLMLIMSWPYAQEVLWLAVILTWISGVDYLVRRS